MSARRLARARDRAAGRLQQTTGGRLLAMYDIEGSSAQLEAAKRAREVQKLTPSGTTARRGALCAAHYHYLRPLRELIGSPPADRTWSDEWTALIEEHGALSGDWLRVLGTAEPSPAQVSEWVRQHGSLASVEAQLHVQILAMEAFGWPRERARVVRLLSAFAPPMARALRDESPCYAASTYALCDAMFAQRAEQVDAGVRTPKVYRHLRGHLGLAQDDPAWERLEAADAAGVRGLTSSSLTMGSSDPRCFDEDGYLVQVTRGAHVVYLPQVSTWGPGFRALPGLHPSLRASWALTLDPACLCSTCRIPTWCASCLRPTTTLGRMRQS